MVDNMAKSPNLQDVFLASARRTEIPVTVFMVNGFQMPVQDTQQLLVPDGLHGGGAPGHAGLRQGADLLQQPRGRTEIPVTVFMVNGFQMRGTITGFDTFTVVLTTEGRQNLIYKHAISTVSPARGVDLSEWEDTL